MLSFCLKRKLNIEVLIYIVFLFTQNLHLNNIKLKHTTQL